MNTFQKKLLAGVERRQLTAMMKMTKWATLVHVVTEEFSFPHKDCVNAHEHSCHTTAVPVARFARALSGGGHCVSFPGAPAAGLHELLLSTGAFAPRFAPCVAMKEAFFA